MKVSRFTLDIIRVVAMIGVVTDHYLQMVRDNDLINTGLYMGGGKRCCILFFVSFFVW